MIALVEKLGTKVCRFLIYMTVDLKYDIKFFLLTDRRLEIVFVVMGHNN